MSLWNVMHRGEVELLKEENTKLKAEIRRLKEHNKSHAAVIHQLMFGVVKTVKTKYEITQGVKSDHKELHRPIAGGGTPTESAAAPSESEPSRGIDVCPSELHDV